MSQAGQEGKRVGMFGGTNLRHSSVEAAASIVIPAHNEEGVIGRCLGSLLAEAEPGEFEVIVVPNGCHDRTAEVASSYGEAVQVIATPITSKSAALNYGDAASTTFPRIYLDADIELSTQAARELVSTVQQPGVMLAVPRLALDLSHASRGVRAYYRVWTQLPSDDQVGRGTIALSRAGRQRFGEFPPILADDLFLSRLFRRDECRVLHDGAVSDKPPRTIREFIRVKTRVIAANLEYRHGRLPQTHEARPSRARALFQLAMRRSNWGDMAVYLTVTAAIRVRAQARLRFGDMRRWERDEASRGVQTPEAAPGRRPGEDQHKTKTSISKPTAPETSG